MLGMDLNFLKVQSLSEIEEMNWIVSCDTTMNTFGQERMQRSGQLKMHILYAGTAVV
jgi:hypothetical protein